MTLGTEEAFLSSEMGRNVSVKSELFLKSKALERTGKIIDLVSQSFYRMKKMSVQYPEWIFGHFICQLLGKIPEGEKKDLVKLGVQQILAKALT